MLIAVEPRLNMAALAKAIMLHGKHVMRRGHVNARRAGPATCRSRIPFYYTL